MSEGRVALTFPSFRYHMTGRVLAVLASEMQAVAVSWQIFAITHRPLDLGLVGLAQFLPGVLLFLVVPDSISHHLVIGPAWFRH